MEPNVRNESNGITIVNWTAYNKRVEEDKEKGKEIKRQPKEISFLRFSSNLDLVDWGKH